MRIWAHLPELERIFDELIKQEGQRQALIDAPEQSSLRSFLEPLIIEQGYLGYLLVMHDGLILAGDREILIGTRLETKEEREFLEQADVRSQVQRGKSAKKVVPGRLHPPGEGSHDGRCHGAIAEWWLSRRA